MMTRYAARVLFAAATLLPLPSLAIDDSDIGTYAVVNVQGQVTKKEFRLVGKAGKWAIEDQQPDGQWVDVTCTGDCVLRASTRSDMERFFSAGVLEQIVPTCIHNGAFAFCRYSPVKNAAQRGYVLVALTQQKPIVLRLARVSPESSHWRDQTGKPVAETESMKSKSDFAGSLLATTDEDWKEKWAGKTPPRFNKAETVPYGKKVFILIFFSNPQIDASGTANVRCDLQIFAPTGKVTLAQKDVTCYTGPLKGDPFALRLSAPVIGFSGDPGDPPGTWAVEVLLRDTVRNVELPLRTTFTLR